MQFQMSRLIINDNEIHIWTANLKINGSLNKYFSRALLSEEELVKAESFKFDKDKSYFMASHTHLRLILGKYLGISPTLIVYGVEEYGKPFLDEQINRYNIRFNISRSHEVAMYALTLNTEIGVDIENINVQLDIEQLIEHVLTLQEIKIFRKIEKENTHKVFYDVWTCKEAILKLTGEGLSFPLNELEVLIYDKHESFKISHIINHQSSSFWSYSLNCPPTYAATIASTRKDNTLRYCDVSNINLIWYC